LEFFLPLLLSNKKGKNKNPAEAKNEVMLNLNEAIALGCHLKHPCKNLRLRRESFLSKLQKFPGFMHKYQGEKN